MLSTTLLRVAATTLLALLLASGTATAAVLPASPAVAPASDPGGEVRPANGEVVLARDGRGPGRLEIDGAPSDAVLTLARGDRAVRSVYVRAGEHAAVRGVPDGTYTVFVTYGTGWDDAARRFTRTATFERWPGDCTFSTDTGPDGTTSSVWTFTLTESADGNITPEPVDAGRYPR